MYIRWMRHIAVLGVALLAAGCATISHDSREQIPIDSDPQGAVVSIDCGNAPIYGGVTPAVILIDRSADPCSFTIAKEGYVEQTVDLERQISRATAGNNVPGVIAGALLGIVALVIAPSDDDLFLNAVEGGYGVATGAANAIDYKSGAAYKHVPGRIFVRLDREL